MQQDALVYPFRTPHKGWGLAAGEFIKRGTFVMQYFGEVFDTETRLGAERLKKYKGSTCTYLMKTHKNYVIDPTTKGSVARFINHSCDPNCETQKWNVLGEICVGIFALRDIKEGEELSFDYRFDCYSTPLTRCYCGTANCKGYLGVMPASMSPEKWEKKLESMPCVICKLVEDSDNNQMLLCDECNRGYHALCLTPPIYSIPKDDWYCPECIEKKCVIKAEAAANTPPVGNTPPVEPGPSFTLEEVLTLAREAQQEIDEAEKEYRLLKLDQQNGKLTEESNIRFLQLERKFITYSRNFLFFYLLQKRLKKKLKPERTPASDDSSSPRRKHAVKGTASSGPKIILISESAQEAMKKSAGSEPMEEIKESATDLAAKKTQLVVHHSSKFQATPQEGSQSPSKTALPRKPELPKGIKEGLQHELELEIKRVVKKREEDLQQNPTYVSDKKERTILRLPSKDLLNVRLCLNVYAESVHTI